MSWCSFLAGIIAACVIVPVLYVLIVWDINGRGL